MVKAQATFFLLRSKTRTVLLALASLVLDVRTIEVLHGEKFGAPLDLASQWIPQLSTIPLSQYLAARGV